MLFNSGIMLAFFLRSVWTVLRQVVHAAAISPCPLEVFCECWLVLATVAIPAELCFVLFPADLPVSNIS